MGQCCPGLGNTQVRMDTVKQQPFQEYSPNPDGNERVTEIKLNMRMARFT